MSIPGSVAEQTFPVDGLGQHTIQDSKFKITLLSDQRNKNLAEH